MLPQASVIQQNVRYSPRLLACSMCAVSRTSEHIVGPFTPRDVCEPMINDQTKSRGEQRTFG